MEPRLILEKETFREVMIETRDLLNLAFKTENNLMHPENMDVYDIWAPYVMTHPKYMYESPGYKIGFLQTMSVVMALREKEKKNKPIRKDNIVDFHLYKERKQH